MSTKSEMWKYFKKINENTVSCNLCDRHIKFHQGFGKTTVCIMGRHFKIHKISANSSTDKEHKVRKPTKKLKTKKSPSKLDDLNPPTYTDTSQKRQRFVSRKCSNKSQNELQMDTLAAAPERISNYSSDEECYAKITDDILYFICIHYRSYNIIQCEGFKHLMKKLAPRYKIPSEDTIKRRLDEKYDMEIQIFKQKLNETLHVTISIDSSSESDEMYEKCLRITIHFVENKTKKLKSRIIEVMKLSEQHTADCIALVLSNILQNYCINNKVVAVVTNDESNIVKAVEQIFGQDKHIICFAHTINLVIENSMKTCEGLSNIINKVRLVVKFIKISIDNKLHCCQVDFGLSKTKLKKLILDVNNKWNSLFYMLEGFVELSTTVINDILFREVNSQDITIPEMPTDDEFIILKEIVVLLRPLAFITQECSAENYITISKIIPLINCALTEYKNTKQTTELSIKLKETILRELQASFDHIELIDSICIATILDPRFKTIHFQNTKALHIIIYKLHEMMDELSSTSHESNTEQKKVKYDLWNHHKSLAHKHEDELSSYLTSPVTSKDDDPLEKWESMKTQFPSLYKVAQRYLSIVATSVPGERLFSKTEMTQSRNQLTEPETLNKISFLNLIDEEYFHKS